MIARFKAGAIADPSGDIGGAARRSGLRTLDEQLKKHQLSGGRLLSSISPAQCDAMERGKIGGDRAVPHRLVDYWRLDARHASLPLDEIEGALKAIPEVDLVYRERSVRGQASTADDPFSGSQAHLGPAPIGVDSRWLWDQGLGGLAPQATTRIASHWSAEPGPMHVADALAAAVASAPRPHLILLDVELADGLPVETDPAIRDVIRCAVAGGIAVVEAAGNGGQDLDAWADKHHRHRLDYASPDFIDSGAIVVASARSALPHNRIPSSNHGSRIDCFAWGENVASAGTFSGTSGAAAIVAGCALLLQGWASSTGTPLQPLALRALLSDPTTGTPQGRDRPGRIGVMPNLRAIVEAAAEAGPIVAAMTCAGEPVTSLG